MPSPRPPPLPQHALLDGTTNLSLTITCVSYTRLVHMTRTAGVAGGIVRRPGGPRAGRARHATSYHTARWRGCRAGRQLHLAAHTPVHVTDASLRRTLVFVCFSFSIILCWWIRENNKKRLCCPGVVLPCAIRLNEKGVWVDNQAGSNSAGCGRVQCVRQNPLIRIEL